MAEAAVVVDKDYVLSPVDPRLYGGFAEHLGRHIYTGLYEPDHPRAEEHGFRTDVLELVRELGMPVIRYPGGNFVSGYNWEDGVGPREKRPVRLDPAWQTTETNAFGTDEFVDWCRLAGVAPMLAVNLGTRGPDEARALVEYCNHPGGTAWSDRRREHGYASPHGVKLWCLGNEMDGPWQMGHKTAAEYGRVACEAAKLMKWTDPGIELIACGSSNRGMSTFGAWEDTVLQHAFDHVDYVSIHTYYENADGDTARFLARPDEMDAFIEEVAAVCDAVAAKKHSRKRLMLGFDEWNVWYSSRHQGNPEPWSVAPPLLEDNYTLADALCVGGMLIALINHADRVKIGCLAQVVNVIAPIVAEAGGPVWKQTIFHPFAQTARHGRGTALQTVVKSSRYEAEPGMDTDHLKLAAVAGGDGSLNLFALNRDLREPLALTVDLRGFGELRVAAWRALHDADLKAVNSAAQPGRVGLVDKTGAALARGTLAAQLPPASWNLLRLEPTRS